MQYVCMSEMQNVSDIRGQCFGYLTSVFGYDFPDIVLDIQNAFQICYALLTSCTHLIKLIINLSSCLLTEYVHLYVNYLLNESIYQQFAAFYHGFHSVCASNALIMLRPEEVEMLVCGNPNLDFEALERVTTYDGYNKKDATVR